MCQSKGYDFVYLTRVKQLLNIDILKNAEIVERILRAEKVEENKCVRSGIVDNEIIHTQRHYAKFDFLQKFKVGYEFLYCCFDIYFVGETCWYHSHENLKFENEELRKACASEKFFIKKSEKRKPRQMIQLRKKFPHFFFF